MAEGSISVVEQRTIAFYGDDLVVVRDEGGTIWVPVNLLCEALGVSRSGQIERIQRDPVLSEELKGCRVTRHPGGEQVMSCLPLKYVRGWLFGINATRVKAEVRDKLIQYQREVIEIIDRAFARVPVAVADADEMHMLAMRDLALQQAELARQQATLWEQLLSEKRRLDTVQLLAEEHDGMIADLERQLDALRRELGSVQGEVSQRLSLMSNRIQLLPAPTDTITPAQKATIKELVDDLVAAAQEAGIRLGQGRNDYPAVWGALKQRFDVAKYDELTLAQFDEVLHWLKTWLDRVRTQPAG